MTAVTGVSFEGIPFHRFLYKEYDNCEGGGVWADVYLPDKTTKNGFTGWPVALAIHGGAFTFGDSQWIFSEHNAYLLKQGFAVVSIEYRLWPHAKLADQREDCVAAYDWIRSPDGLNKALGDLGKVNGDRIFYYGGSGGGIASWYLTMDLLAQNKPLPKAIYVLYPITDFNAPLSSSGEAISFDEIFKRASELLSPEEQTALRTVLDGPTATRFNIRGEFDQPARPRRIMWEAVMKRGALLPDWLQEPVGHTIPPQKNPIDSFTPQWPPTVLIKAELDELIPNVQTQMAYDRLKELGVDTQLLLARGMYHGDGEETIGTLKKWKRDICEVWWDEVYKPALDFCISRTKQY